MAGAEVAIKPAVATVPLARVIVPVEAQHIAAAARTPKNGSIKKDVSDITIRLGLEALGDEVLVFPESLEDAGVKADDIFHILESCQLLLADYGSFLSFESGFQTESGDIKRGERERALVLLFLTFQPTTFRRTFPDAPAGSDEFHGIERNRAIDGDGFDLPDQNLRPVLEKEGELFPRFRWMLKNPVGSFLGNSFQINIGQEGS